MTEATQQTPEQIAAESEAAFAAGYDGERGRKPAPAPAARPAEPAKTAAQPKEDAPAATSSTATEAQPQAAKVETGEQAVSRQEIDALKQAVASVAKVPDRLRAIEGNLGGLAQLTKDLQSAVAKATTVVEKKGAEAPTQAQVVAAVRDPELWKRLKEDYPEWASAIEPELADLRSQIDQLRKSAAPPVDASAIKTEINTDVDKRIATSVKSAEERGAINGYIAAQVGWKWRERIATQAFEDWYAKQPKDIQALSASSDPDDAVKLVRAYDDHAKRVAEEAAKKKRLDRAAVPQGVAAVTASTEDPEAAFAKGYEEARAGR